MTGVQTCALPISCDRSCDRRGARALDELFARVQPLVGRESVTLDLDATYIEHHGPVGSRQGTRGTYKGKVCWHPLCCFVGESGEWLHARLRNGHAAASTGATRFLDECLRRLPDGVRLFLRADEGFWGQDFFAALEIGRASCRERVYDDV